MRIYNNYVNRGRCIQTGRCNFVPNQADSIRIHGMRNVISLKAVIFSVCNAIIIQKQLFKLSLKIIYIFYQFQ